MRTVDFSGAVQARIRKFSLTPDLDIDECVSGIHNCPIDIASCKNTEGSYECACNHGYVGEGKSSCIGTCN